MATKHELSREELLSHAYKIAKSYKGQNLTLTLRQLYYQMVARGIIPSGQLYYSRLGDTLTDARYEGTFPVEWILDRGRDVAVGRFTRCDMDALGAIDRVLDHASDWIRKLPTFLVQSSRWADQPVHVSVWVEKQALEGVFEPICEELGVSWFACKGYPSVSALWDWIKQTNRAMKRKGERLKYHFPRTEIEWSEWHRGRAEKAVVLYFGDHDPDGWEIPRSAERNLHKLMDTKGIDFPIEFKRVALNMDQIDEYSPPPFEAKITSARYKSYVEEHNTQDAWELDALEPSVLVDLIRENVEERFDEGLHDSRKEDTEALREELRERMRDPDWFSAAVAKEEE